MSIEKCVLEQLDISRYRTVRSFFSRRNSVSLVRGSRGDGADMEFVYKSYISGDPEKEYHYLSTLAGRNVPKLLARGKHSLCLEYIKGSTLLEKLEECERKGLPFQSYIDAFLDFLEMFYTLLPGHIYGDINFRNFIITENGLFGVDLEEAGKGDRNADIGRAAAFILTYDPAGTDIKKAAAAYLIESSSVRFGLDRKSVEAEKQNELAAMAVRRGRRTSDEKTKAEL